MTRVDENPYEVHIEVDEEDSATGWTEDGRFISRVDTVTLPEICYDTGRPDNLVPRTIRLSYAAKYAFVSNTLLIGGILLGPILSRLGMGFLSEVALACLYSAGILRLAFRKNVTLNAFEHVSVRDTNKNRKQTIYPLTGVAILSTAAVALSPMPRASIVVACVSFAAIAHYDSSKFPQRSLAVSIESPGYFAISGFSDEFHRERLRSSGQDDTTKANAKDASSDLPNNLCQ